MGKEYILCMATAALGLALAREATADTSAAAAGHYQRLLQNAALSFEACPQSNGTFVFRARGANHDFWIKANEAQILLSKVQDSPSPAGEDSHKGRTAPRTVSWTGVKLSLTGANPDASVSGTGELAGRLNYLIGNDRQRWRTGLPTYTGVRVQEVYAGVDVLYYGNHKQLEYDFNVRPGAKPEVIELQFEGARDIRVDDEGRLVIDLGEEHIVQPRPTLYQMKDGRQQAVEGGYRLLGPGRVGFKVGQYDASQTLTIDPILSYSSFFGGDLGDLALAVKVDTSGFIYVAGETLSSEFPMALPPGGFQTKFGGGKINGDAFVAKFDPIGFGLVYFTYLGGAGNDGALDLALDASGNARIAGFTDSGDFPTRNALFPTIGGSTAGTGTYYTDAFVAQLNTNGSDLVFSTYLGGSGVDVADAVAVDPNGFTYVAGYTYSTNFPLTSGALTNATPSQTRFHGGYDGFVAKFAPSGIPLVYSSYVGGTNSDEVQGIAADAAGNAYLTGYTSSTNFPITTNAFRKVLNGYFNKQSPSYDAFVTKVSSNGDALVYSTFLGGTNSDAGFRIVVDPSGNAILTGSSQSLDFPNTLTNLEGITVGFTNLDSRNTDAFLTKVSPEGDMVYSSRFGGTREDVGWDIALDAVGNVFIVGTSTSTNFPVYNATNFAYPEKQKTGLQSVFVTAFAQDASSLLYSLTLGGKHNDMGLGIAADPAGNVYIVGKTQSTNFPVVGALQSSLMGSNDTFLVKIGLEPKLAALLDSGGLEMRWRAFAPEYILESIQPGSTPDPIWEPVPVTPVISDGWYQVTIQPTNTSGMYRLRKTD